MGPEPPKPPKASKAAAAAPTAEDPAVEDARRKELEAQAKSRGRAATILNGSEGDTSEAELAKKKLKRVLGGD